MHGYIGLRDYDYSVNFLTLEVLHFGRESISIFEIEIFKFTAWLSVDIENEKWYEWIEKLTEPKD